LVLAADDEKSWGANVAQAFHCEISPTSSGHDGIYVR
jgi:hypothetical protein